MLSVHPPKYKNYDKFQKNVDEKKYRLIKKIVVPKIVTENEIVAQKLYVELPKSKNFSSKTDDARPMQTINSNKKKNQQSKVTKRATE